MRFSAQELRDLRAILDLFVGQFDTYSHVDPATVVRLKVRAQELLDKIPPK